LGEVSPSADVDPDNDAPGIPITERFRSCLFGEGDSPKLITDAFLPRNGELGRDPVSSISGCWSKGGVEPRGDIPCCSSREIETDGLGRRTRILPRGSSVGVPGEVEAKVFGEEGKYMTLGEVEVEVEEEVEEVEVEEVEMKGYELLEMEEGDICNTGISVLSDLDL